MAVQDSNFPVKEEERWKYLFTSIANITAAVDGIRSENNSFVKTMETFNTKVNNFEQRMSHAESSLSNIESLTRAKNIILFKLTDTDDFNSELISRVRNIFQEVNLQIPEVAIDDAFRLGRIQGNRPTMGRFISSKWVWLIFSKVRELRKCNIFISNDRTKQERDYRRKMLEQVRNLREGGQNAILRGSKIVILNDNPEEKNSLTEVRDEKQSGIKSSRKRSHTSPSASQKLDNNPEKTLKKNKKTGTKGSKNTSITESLDGYFSTPTSTVQKADINGALTKKLSFEE